MNKYYRVMLFDGGIPDRIHSGIEYIIVKKTCFGVREILTGYNLTVLEKEPGNYIWRDHAVVINRGHYPVVCEKDFKDKNIATPAQIDDYVNNYERSEWKQIYEDLKKFSVEEQRKVRRKVRKVYGTKA